MKEMLIEWIIVGGVLITLVNILRSFESTDLSNDELSDTETGQCLSHAG